ncbi:hypothetical protein GCK32_016636 [Trichostrongylus colubriformis]|uniref:Uncharacterized protein n=1 Tax=Trichostrongylus colubriformis TaxID=6319 RepID=A0AAN8IJ03_TRICO
MEKKLQQKKEKEKLERKKKRPRQMRAAKLDPREFKARGPLVLQAALRGEVENLDPMSKTQPTPTTTPAPKALMRSIDRTQTPSLESDDTTTTRFTGSREKTASSGSAEKTKTS